MDEVIVVEDVISQDGMRSIHWMANHEIKTTLPGGFFVESNLETGVHHLRVKVPVRGVVDFHCEGWPKFRRLVVWSLEGCTSVRDAIGQAYVNFWITFTFRPAYVFMKKLPVGVEDGQDFEDLILLETEWMIE